MNEKQVQWDKIAQNVDIAEDGKSKGIDGGIKETVIALNVLNINTSQSCEGHIDWGYAGPWVEISPEPTEGLKKLRDDIRALALEVDMKEKTKAPREELEQLFAKTHKLEAKEDRYVLPEIKKVFDLLTEFYKERNPGFGQILVLRFYRSDARLMCQGTELQGIVSPEEKVANLKRYQDEIGLFTEFLKKKYFQD
jgi:hypothetical protein